MKTCDPIQRRIPISLLLGSTPPSGLASALGVNIVFVVRHIITKELLSKMVKKIKKNYKLI